jgi:sugar phosphate isomerase/epimerase
MEFAKQIGARNISITSGRCLGGMPPDQAAKQLAESIKPILDRAQKLDVRVGIECEPGLFVEYVAELKEWIDRLGSPYLGANLDIGHSQVIGESIPEVVRMLKGRIWNMHVEDIPGRKHYHMIPGEATLDWNALRDAVREIEYDRFLTVELYTHTAEPQVAAEKSHAFLRKLFA